MSKINLTILPYKEYAKGGGVKKNKKTDFTISEYIQLEKQKLREHNAEAHEDDRLDWADWKSELTKEDTKEYGIYYNSRMLDSNGDRGVFEYLPTNKNYSQDEYAKGGGVQQPSYAIKLSELLNKYEPTLIGISRGMVQVTPSMAYSGAELSNMFKGFGDSMDIKNIVYRSLRDKESYPIVEKLTKGKYKLIKPTWSDNFEDYYFDNITKKEKGGGTKKEFIAKKVGKVMREFKEGDLHIGTSNKIVNNPKQAIAIALSEGKRGWKHKNKR
jgi:hypothetical protein